MLDTTDIDHDTITRLFLLLGMVAGFAGLFVAPIGYGVVAFVCGAYAVWLERPAAGVVVAAWGAALVVLSA